MSSTHPVFTYLCCHSLLVWSSLARSPSPTIWLAWSVHSCPALSLSRKTSLAKSCYSRNPISAKAIPTNLTRWTCSFIRHCYPLYSCRHCGCIRMEVDSYSAANKNNAMSAQHNWSSTLCSMVSPTFLKTGSRSRHWVWLRLLRIRLPPWWSVFSWLWWALFGLVKSCHLHNGSVFFWPLLDYGCIKVPSGMSIVENPGYGRNLWMYYLLLPQQRRMWVAATMLDHRCNHGSLDDGMLQRLEGIPRSTNNPSFPFSPHSFPNHHHLLLLLYVPMFISHVFSLVYSPLHFAPSPPIACPFLLHPCTLTFALFCLLDYWFIIKMRIFLLDTFWWDGMKMGDILEYYYKSSGGG